MIIPFSQLSTEVFTGILHDLVTRDGTDYGDAEMSEAQKVAQLQYSIQEGMCFLVFDSATESLGVMNREQAKQLGLL